jgi:hypothetical protein
MRSVVLANSASVHTIHAVQSVSDSSQSLWTLSKSCSRQYTCLVLDALTLAATLYTAIANDHNNTYCITTLESTMRSGSTCALRSDLRAVDS